MRRLPGQAVPATIQRLNHDSGRYDTVATISLTRYGGVLMQPEPGYMIVSTGAPVARKRLMLFAAWPDDPEEDNPLVAQAGDILVIAPGPGVNPGDDGSWPISDAVAFSGQFVQLYIERQQMLRQGRSA